MGKLMRKHETRPRDTADPHESEAALRGRVRSVNLRGKAGDEFMSFLLTLSLSLYLCLYAVDFSSRIVERSTFREIAFVNRKRISSLQTRTYTT